MEADVFIVIACEPEEQTILGAYLDLDAAVVAKAAFEDEFQVVNGERKLSDPFWYTVRIRQVALNRPPKTPYAWSLRNGSQYPRLDEAGEDVTPHGDDD